MPSDIEGIDKRTLSLALSSLLINVLHVSLPLPGLFGRPLFLLSPAFHLRATLDGISAEHVTDPCIHLRHTRVIPISSCSVGFKSKVKQC